LQKWKAGEIAIRAFSLAKEQLPDLMLEMIGTGPDREFLGELSEELGVSEAVAFRGSVSMKEVEFAMRSADVLLFTSIRDTSGNVVLEAMSQGLPVIAIRHNGVAEMCTEESARLIEPGSIQNTVDAFAREIERLAASPSLRVQIAEAGIKRVEEKFLWKVKAIEMSRIYSSLIEPSN
jgi:glycosyltransferase involved in cell wall biosynthesis